MMNAFNRSVFGKNYDTPLGHTIIQLFPLLLLNNTSYEAYDKKNQGDLSFISYKYRRGSLDTMTSRHSSFVFP